MEIVTKMLISEETKRFAILELFRNARKAHILHCEEMKAFRNSRLSSKIHLVIVELDWRNL
jgi:hypothetical protein